MSKKVICESCGTIFREEIVKDMSDCPVCGTAFDDEATENRDITLEDEKETGKSTVYFIEIMTYDNHPVISAFCGSCGYVVTPNLDLVEEIVDGDHVTLKKGTILKCEKCGEEHTARTIPYRPPKSSALPHCPVCNSVMLKKISKGSKLLMAAIAGSDAIPYNIKTYQCKNCGHIF